MKLLKFVLCIVFIGSLVHTNAQTVDEIIDNYFENIGGKDAWRNLEGILIEGKMNMARNGMSMKTTTVQLKDGRQYTIMYFQGNEMKQNVFDGNLLWGSNFMTGKGEQFDSETSENFKKNQAKDFPNPLLDYKSKGYSVELIGKEELEGTPCFKVKLTKNPIMIDGIEQEVIQYYYFDIENFVPIGIEGGRTGSFRGGRGGRGSRGGNQQRVSAISDYQEVNGLFFAFSRSMGRGTMTIDKVILNPKVNDTDFSLPKED